MITHAGQAESMTRAQDAFRNDQILPGAELAAEKLTELAELSS